nr:MAG TPA: hypothetical protein [Caudoviricetes sp.]
MTIEPSAAILNTTLRGEIYIGRVQGNHYYKRKIAVGMRC